MPLPPEFKKAHIKRKNALVSVIIPAYNEEGDIEECLKSLEKQTYKNHEVIVIDDGSTDNTINVVKTYPKVKLLQQNHKGPGEARNLGAQKAKGEVLVLIDADMVLFPDYVEKLTKPIRENETLGTIESIQYNVHETKMQECWGKVVRTKQLEGINSSTVRAIAKKDFIALGGFDKKYGYADDRTFFLKYGVRFLILEDVKCYHKTPRTFKGVFKHSRWIGASLVDRVPHFPGAKEIAPFLLIAISPLAIPVLAVKKSYQDKAFKLLIPWMLVFMTARYFGTINGLFRKIFLKTNVK